MRFWSHQGAYFTAVIGARLNAKPIVILGVRPTLCTGLYRAFKRYRDRKRRTVLMAAFKRYIDIERRTVLMTAFKHCI